MVSKKEELKALSDIKKIVETLGLDSYVGVAFEGCFEIAEQNIECDFLCSMKQRYDSANKELSECKRKLEEYQSTVVQLQKVTKENKDLIEEIEGLYVERFAETVRTDNAESEIVSLKAKLYDLMCK